MTLNREHADILMMGNPTAPGFSKSMYLEDEWGQVTPPWEDDEGHVGAYRGITGYFLSDMRTSFWAIKHQTSYVESCYKTDQPPYVFITTEGSITCSHGPFTMPVCTVEGRRRLGSIVDKSINVILLSQRESFTNSPMNIQEQQLKFVNSSTIIAESKRIQVPSSLGKNYEIGIAFKGELTPRFGGAYLFFSTQSNIPNSAIAYGETQSVSRGTQFTHGTSIDIERLPESSERGNPVSALRQVLPHLHIDHGVVAFCTQYRLFDALSIAVNLVKRCFHKVQEARLQLEQDPELGEEKLILDITIHGDIDEVLESYDAYTSQWVTAVPWPQRDYFRLSYDII